MGNITLPNSMTTIGPCAFRESNVTIIYLPSTIKSVGNNAFFNSSLISFNYTSGMSIGNSPFAWTPMSYITLPSYRSMIYDYEFAYTNLKYIDIPESVISIGKYAFAGCHFDEISLPEGITYLGESAFRDTCIKKIYLLSTLKTVYLYCFYNAICELIDFPENFQAFNTYCFEFSNVPSLIIPPLVTVIPPLAFANSLIRHIKLSDRITDIGNYAFSNASLLEDIELPETLKNKGMYTFQLTTIKTIRIPSKVETFLDGLFMNSFLETIYIPSGLKYIEKLVFYNSSLKDAEMPESHVYIKENVFYNTFLSYLNLK